MGLDWLRLTLSQGRPRPVQPGRRPSVVNLVRTIVNLYTRPLP